MSYRGTKAERADLRREIERAALEWLNGAAGKLEEAVTGPNVHQLMLACVHWLRVNKKTAKKAAAGDH